MPPPSCSPGRPRSPARRAQQDLAEHYGVGAALYSATSYKRLREEALEAERWNRLHPGDAPRVPYVTRLLADSAGPVIAVSDFMKAVPDQVARWVPRRFRPLGTDGFGRSDTREALRRFFEIDAAHTVVATLAALAEDGTIEAPLVGNAIERYELDPDVTDPEDQLARSDHARRMRCHRFRATDARSCSWTSFSR